MIFGQQLTAKANFSHLLRQSGYWFIATFFLVLEVYILNGFLFCWLSNKFISSSFVYTLELTILCITFANGLYCLVTYLMGIYSNVKSQLFSGSVGTVDFKRTMGSAETAKANCVRSLCAFMGNFFKQPAPSPKEINTSLSSTLSEMESRNSSLSSLVGYHDSPLNKTVSSVHSRSQLNDLLSNETCDSVVDPIDCSAYFNYDLSTGRWYQTGTPQFLQPNGNDALDCVKSFMSENKHQRRPDKRIFNRARSDSSPKVQIDTDIKEILQFYQLNEQDMEAYEIKLRIWLCNTILRPLVKKIEEVNKILSEEYSMLHLKIGNSNLETVQNALMHKQDLCKTFIPFVLPYLRFHNNQEYIVSRIYTLSQNVALEDFKWNGGGSQIVRDENNCNTAFNRVVNWNEQLPTDTEIIWHLFCTYMDFHLSPSSEAITTGNEFNKPFSNVFFVKSSTGKLPLVLDSTSLLQHQVAELTDKFFIRMKSDRPPIFELVVDGGDAIILPNKNTPQNFWLVFILYLAHVKRLCRSRISHLHISSLSLDIFDL